MVMGFGQVHLTSHKSTAGNKEKETKKGQSWLPALATNLYFKILENKIIAFFEI